MIGDYKGIVKNKVITALLQSYLDVLDYDGLKSILREANMFKLKDQKNIDPEGTIDFFSLKKILAAQNCLLYESDKVLFEIGRKFSFYLYPYGKNFHECINEITYLIQTDWDVEIIKNTSKEIQVKVINCVFCSELGVPCHLFKGFIVNTLEKTLTANETIHYSSPLKDLQDPDHNSFILTLTIEKKYNK